MFDTAIYSAYILSIILLLATPGPVTLLVIHTSNNHGFKNALATITGTNTASLILIGASFAILQGVIILNQNALQYITLLGSIYLLYFAFSLFKTNYSAAIQPTKTSHPNKNAFYQGFIIGIINPKDILFFTAFFPLFFKLTPYPYLTISILIITWVICDYIILSSYALFVHRIKHHTINHLINQLSAIILIIIALYAFYHAIKHLIN